VPAYTITEVELSTLMDTSAIANWHKPPWRNMAVASSFAVLSH